MSKVDEKIAELRNSWHDAFKAICVKRCDMEWLNCQAVEALKSAVDNDMTSKELGAMLSSFARKRFGSTLVRNFLKKICSKTLPDEAPWRKTINCVEINGQYSCKPQSVVCDDASISITFVDTASSRAFKIVVPVKENIWIDFARQTDAGMGKYMLMCLRNKNRSDLLTSISNPLVVAAMVTKACNIKNAVNDFMTGKFDDEIADASTIDISCFKSYKLWKYPDESFTGRHSRFEETEFMSPTDELFRSIDEHELVGFDGWRSDNSYKYIKNLVVD